MQILHKVLVFNLTNFSKREAENNMGKEGAKMHNGGKNLAVSSKVSNTYQIYHR